MSNKRAEDRLSPVKQALLAVEEMRAKLESVQRASTEPIAIIGMGCRFPGGASSPEAFWSVLSQGVDCITEVPADRWSVNKLYDPNPDVPGCISTRWGGFLEDVDKFDAQFFSISPREAASMDPQQRLFLEVASESLECAGLPARELAGTMTGVFVGVCFSDYSRIQPAELSGISAYCASGESRSIIANRLSYLLDLRGPSLAVDTACSSSLLAVHLACQSLRGGECTIALAGGVNLLLAPESFVAFSKAHMMAADGRCKTFDAQADGFVRGEGCGVVVLKRLSAALDDGDTIWALIRGSSVNQDGATNGLTAPNSLSQQEVIRQALRNAHVKPEQVSFVEAHGSGTILGDPIEMESLREIYGQPRPPGFVCAIGSVKTNLGHLEGAAGIAGLTKIVLSMTNEAIPPHLHFSKLNPNIRLEDSPFVIPTELRPWPRGEERRFASVSSFGMGGTNVHVVLEEGPAQLPSSAPAGIHVLPISAHNGAALQELARSYRGIVAKEHASMPDVCYTASVHRSHHDFRLALVGWTREEYVDQLDAFIKGQGHPGMFGGSQISGQGQVVFVFPGQGSQWFGMGRQLLEEEPVFRDTLEKCECAMRAFVDWSLLKVLTADQNSSWLEEIDVVQPVLFALEVALAAVWRSWGVEPAAVIGHSMGEAAAACVAGALPLEDAAKVICRRSRLLRRVCGKGAMAYVELSMDQAEKALAGYEGRLSIAASNSPVSTVLSGDTEGLQQVLQALEHEGVFCRMVKVDVASHSPQMDPLRADLLELLDGLRPTIASVPMYSTVTGGFLDGKELEPHYWVRNLREPVLFSDGIRALVHRRHDLFIEMSPHPVLLPSLRQCGAAVAFPSLRRQEEERRVMLESLAGIYAHGYDVNWRRLHPRGGRQVLLPSYPWQRERFWVEDPLPGEMRAVPYRGGRTDSAPQHPLLGGHLQSSVEPWRHFWETELSASRALAYFGDHRVQGLAVLPAAAYIEMALAAAGQVLGPAPLQLESVGFEKALVLDEGRARMVQVSLSLDVGEAWRFAVASRSQDALAEDTWVQHTCGTLRRADAAARAPDLDAVRRRCGEVDADAYYLTMRAVGLEYGPSFRGIDRLWHAEGEALARIRLPEGAPRQVASHIHPSLLDSCFQMLVASLPTSQLQEGKVLMPLGVGRLVWHRPPGSVVWCYARRSGENQELACDEILVDEEGNVVVEVLGLQAQWLPSGMRESLERPGDWMYIPRWHRAEALEGRELQPERPGSWLLLADRAGAAKALQALLAELGEQCVLAVHGDGYRCVQPGEYVVDPRRPEGFRELLRDAFAGQHPPVRGIVHLWNLDARPVEKTTLESLDEAADLGCIAALHLVQSLVLAGWPELPHLWLVTRGLQAVGECAAEISPAQAMLWGFGRVVCHEHPELRCTLVDLGREPSSDEHRALFFELWVQSGEEQVALRSSERYVARLTRGGADHPENRRLELRSDATYLITGGLGGLGLSLAEWMVDRGARHLVLVGRSGASAAAAELVDRLEQRGASIHVATADVAQRETVVDLLADMRRRLPPLRGVVHAAGLLDDGTLLRLDRQRVRSVLAPKIAGAWNLHELTRSEELDFFVLFSSAASLLGSPGQGNYCAANSFLDGLAHYRRGQGFPALAVNWGAFSDIGLATQSNRAGRLALKGVGSLSPAQGKASIEFLLGLGAACPAQVGILHFDVEKWLNSYPAGAGLAFLSDVPRKHVTAHGRRTSPVREELSRVLPEKKRALLEAYLRGLIAQVLRIAPARVDPNKPLTSFGLDSLMALELRNHIRADLAVNISVLTFFQGLSLMALSDDVLERLTAQELLARVGSRKPKADAEDEVIII